MLTSSISKRGSYSLASFAPTKHFKSIYHNKRAPDLTLAFLWLRLSEDSLKVMEGLWDLPDAFGEKSWWGLLPIQLQLLSLRRTLRGSLMGQRQGRKDRMSNHCVDELKSQTTAVRVTSLQSQRRRWERQNEEGKYLLAFLLGKWLSLILSVNATLTSNFWSNILIFIALWWVKITSIYLQLQMIF